MSDTTQEASSLDLARSWIDWTRHLAANAQYETRGKDWDSDQDTELVGRMIQASAEHPEDFARVFSPILGPGPTNPLTELGEGVLLNLVRNGVGDDWEIFLQWREEGYVVVHEGDRRPQDARFGFNEAFRLLNTLTGGAAMAPGIADEAALVQQMHEVEPAPRWQSGKCGRLRA